MREMGLLGFGPMGAWQAACGKGQLGRLIQGSGFWATLPSGAQRLQEYGQGHGLWGSAAANVRSGYTLGRRFGICTVWHLGDKSLRLPGWVQGFP